METEQAVTRPRPRDADHAVAWPAPESSRRGVWWTVTDVAQSPRLLGIASLSAATALLVAGVMRLNGGPFSYVLDDAYIHLAIARNLAQTGTFGVEPGVFVSASSSPGWTLLLALAGLAGATVMKYAPLVLGAAAAVLVVWLLASSPGSGVTRRWGVLGPVFWVALPLLLFLPSLVMTGMEHVLHAAVVLLVAARWVGVLEALAAGVRPERATLIWLGVLTAAAMTLRLETAFLAAGFSVGALAATLGALAPPGARVPAAKRLAGTWVALVAPAVLVLGVIAAVNVAFGEHPLPTTLLAKTNWSGTTGLLPDPRLAWQGVQHDPMLAGLLTAFLWLVIWAVRTRRFVSLGLAAGWLTAAGLHLTYAHVGWFHRYEAYLLVLAVWLLLDLARRAEVAWSPLPALAGLLALSLVFTLSARPLYTRDTALGANNTYDQQVQMGRFAAAAYPGAAVAVNDLGAVAYLHDGPVLDLVGLGSSEVLDARREGAFGPEYVEELAQRRDVELAMVYDELIEPPASWVKVAEWHLSRRQVIPVMDRVALYATSRVGAERLADELQRFESQLPAGVRTEFFVDVDGSDGVL